MSHDTDSIAAARAVLSAHINALNERDSAALADTLHFPHFRLSGSDLKTWDGPDSYIGDFLKRAGGTWARSEFRDIQVQRSSDTKVHFDLEVVRFDAADKVITRFCSLWVVTCENGRWAAKFRSSFAAL